jgi:hypothetical protein
MKDRGATHERSVRHAGRPIKDREMKSWGVALKDSLFSGTITNADLLAALAVFAKARRESAISPINAISHAVWGQRAARADSPSLQYTIPSLIINQVGTILWAMIYEKLRGEDVHARRILPNAGLISALAYITDYRIMPKRLTPGYELRLPPKALYGIYGALALSLASSTAASRMEAPLIHKRIR